jgi:APA family basic amino acid/polyamine antiporter
VIVVVWAVTLLNMLSVRAAGSFQVITLLVKVVPLLVVIVLAALALADGRAAPPRFEASAITLAGLNGAAVLTLWALVGFESASISAQQVDNPERNVALATFWGTALTGLIYLAVCSAIALLLPADLASGSPAPFATFVERYWGAGPAAADRRVRVVSCVGALKRAHADGRRAAADDGRGRPAAALDRPARTPAGHRAARWSSRPPSPTSARADERQRRLQAAFEFLLLLSTSATLWLFLACTLAALRLGVSRVLAVWGRSTRCGRCGARGCGAAASASC